MIQIQQNQIHSPVPHHIEGFFPALHVDDIRPFRAQAGPHNFPDLRLVVDEQNRAILNH
jgi:hypothetical protein